RRGFSRREKRSVALWKGPAALCAGLMGASGALLSLPMFGGSEQAGILAGLALAGKAAMAWPFSAARSVPGTVAALSDLFLRDRAFAAFSILSMLPVGFVVSRLWARRSIRP